MDEYSSSESILSTSPVTTVKSEMEVEDEGELEYEVEYKPFPLPLSSPPPSEPDSDSDWETGSRSKSRSRRKKKVKNMTASKTPASSSSAFPRLSSNCAYCSYNSGPNRQTDMKRHLVCLHPETLFKSEINSWSLSSWKSEQFKNILMEIVFPKFNLTNEDPSLCSCSVCGKKCSKGKCFIQLRVHIFYDHIEEVRESLKDVMGQSEASLLEQLDNIRKSMKTEMKDNGKIECKWKKPAPSPHEEKLDSEIESGNEDEEEVFPDKRKRARKIRASTSSAPTTKKAKKTKASTPSALSEGDKPFCEFCNKTFTRLLDLRRHWKYSCPSSTSFKRDRPSCEFCSKTFSQPSSVKKHIKYSCPNRPTSTSSGSSKLTCAYCTHECINRPEYMKRHLVHCHPERLFDSERNSSSDWKNEHFKRILMEIAIPKFIKTEGTVPSCSICSKKYTSKKLYDSRYELNRHVLDEHIEEVREYLKTLLEESDASLQGKLVKKKGKPSLFCEFCNKSFTSSKSAERHRKYHCPNGERLYRPKPTPSSATITTLICEYCGHECASGRSNHLKRHVLRCHPETFFQSEKTLPLSRWKDKHFKRILMDIAIPKFILREGAFAKCTICEKKYTDKQFNKNRCEMNRHLIYYHNEEVRGYLKELLDQSDKYLQKQLDDDQSESDTCDSDGDEDENFDEMDVEAFMDMDMNVDDTSPSCHGSG